MSLVSGKGESVLTGIDRMSQKTSADNHNSSNDETNDDIAVVVMVVIIDAVFVDVVVVKLIESSNRFRRRSIAEKRGKKL